MPIPVRALALLVASLAANAGARAEEPCTPLTWEVSHEQALFAGTPKGVAAGRDAAGAPQLSADQLYELDLTPQDQIALATASDKKSRSGASFGGLVRLHVATAGTYRISLARPAWIEIVGEHGTIASGDHVGGGCGAPHKIVQFALPPGELILQLTAVDVPQMQLAVTRAP